MRATVGHGTASARALPGCRDWSRAPVPPWLACHHRVVRSADGVGARASIPSEAAGARLRMRLDWRTFVWLVLAVLGRAGAAGRVPQLVDDAHAHRHRRADRPRPRPARRLASSAACPMRRGFAVADRRPRRPRRARRCSCSCSGRGPSPRPASSPSSCPRRSTSSSDSRWSAAGCGTRIVDEGAERGSTTCPSSSPTSASPRCAEHARERRRQRRHRRRGGDRRADRRREPARPVPPPAPPSQRQRRPTRSVGVVYRTLGRYFGGSITVAVLMGLYVLALGLDPRRAARPAGGGLGDDHRPHPAGRRLPRRVVLRAARRDPGRADGDHRRRPVRRST